MGGRDTLGAGCGEPISVLEIGGIQAAWPACGGGLCGHGSRSTNLVQRHCGRQWQLCCQGLAIRGWESLGPRVLCRAAAPLASLGVGCLALGLWTTAVTAIRSMPKAGHTVGNLWASSPLASGPFPRFLRRGLAGSLAVDDRVDDDSWREPKESSKSRICGGVASVTVLSCCGFFLGGSSPTNLVVLIILGVLELRAWIPRPCLTSMSTACRIGPSILRIPLPWKLINIDVLEQNGGHSRHPQTLGMPTDLPKH